MNPNVHLLSFLNDLYDREPPRLRFTATTEAEWRAWRETARKRLRELLTLEAIGRYAWRDAPAPVVTERVEEADHVRERVLLPTLEGLWLPCFALVPPTPPPHPAVLCLHGHGMSKHILAGVPREDRERELLEKLRGDYARKFAQAGFLTVAPDAAGYGERTEEGTEGWSQNSCQHLFVNALSLGFSLQGLRVWEFLKALDYLAARPDVQPEQLAVAGLSMGCEQGMYVAALDERVRAAVLSCCLRAILPDAKRISWCPCLFSPGLFTALDWPDIGALIAPRPVQLQFGNRDYVPLDLARQAHALLQRAYDLSGAPADALEYDEFSGAHEFHFAAALPFVQRRLAGDGETSWARPTPTR
jgi:pimeloyl-ACP methyl ester carboxylesterase